VFCVLPGEKSSLLSKLFGRNKTKDPIPVKEEEDAQDMVEYATFSAQFPPPEWNWYESQIARLVEQQDQPIVHHGGTVMIPRSNTWHHMTPAQMLDDETQSDLDGVYDEIQVHSADCPIGRSHTLPAEIVLSQHQPSQHQPALRSCSSPSESWSSQSELPIKTQRRVVSGSSHSKSFKHDQSGERHSRLHDTCSYEQDNPSALPLDVRPKVFDTTNSDPSRRDDNKMYYKNTFDSPQLLNNASMPPERPIHVNKVFKKYREMKCTSFCTNDISVEYCGKMPRKSHGISKSRDSGVNCIGLSNSNVPKPQMYGKNHYNAYQMPVSNCEEPGKDNTAPRPNALVHQAQIHMHPGASHEDSGFNSMRIVDSQDSAYSHLHDPGLFSSPPNNLSPSQQYDNCANDVQSFHKEASGVRNPSQSPEHLNCEDRYPAQDLTNMTNGYCNVEARNTVGDNQGSGTSIWSDSSKQTVREVGPQGMQRRLNESRKSTITSPTHQALPRESSPIRHRSQNVESHINGEPSKHSHRHTRPKSPRRPTKDSDRYPGERYPRSRPTSRPGSATGKSLANQVYESHQKRQSRGKCPVVEQPRDLRERGSYNNNQLVHSESKGGRGAKPKVVGIV
jgi:hypothetical protein